MDDGSELVTRMAASLQGMPLAPERAAELAAEAGRLNAAVRAAVDRLAFDDDPAAYAALLAKHAPR